MDCVLTKDRIVDMIKKVVFPIARKFEEYCKDEERIFQFEIALTKLAIIFLLPDKQKIKLLKSKGVPLKYLHILGEHLSRELEKEFLDLHSKWIEENCNPNKQKEEENNQLEFFDFESEEIDNNINSMHYKDEDKVDAKTFMSSSVIDEDFLAELNDLMIEVDDFIYQYEDIEIDEQFLEKLKFLKTFIKAFEYSIEFKDIGYALETFMYSIQDIDLNSLDKEQKEMLKQMILSILQDLKTWIKEVIIEQTAKDIHYLDASLLANIAQIDIMLKSFEQKENEDDDFELF